VRRVRAVGLQPGTGKRAIAARFLFEFATSERTAEGEPTAANHVWTRADQVSGNFTGPVQYVETLTSWHYNLLIL
jgi:hypothetical protein